MQPERKIEKLLRAYAKKRQATEGDAFKLSPATRRRLQDEVAKRLRGEEAEEPASVSIWELFRRQWAFLTAFALAIFLGAALIMPMLSTSKNRGRYETTMAPKKPVEQQLEQVSAVEPAPAPTVAPAMVPPPAAPPPAGAFALGSRNANERKPGMLTNTIVLNNPAPMDYLADRDKDVRPGENQSLAGLAPATEKSVGSLESAGSGGGGAGGAAVTVASGSLRMTDVSLAKAEPVELPRAAASRSLQFRNVTDNGLGNAYRNLAPSAQNSVVLRNFKVVQQGASIQIVDRDGSVYRGSWQPGAAQAIPNLAAINGNGQVLDQKQLPVNGVVQLQNQNGSVSQMAAQTYLVTVSGDNLTLKQRVVFTGNLSLVLNAAAANNASLSNGTAAFYQFNTFSAAPSQTAQNAGNHLNNGPDQSSIWAGSYLVGKAVVAGTNQVDISAVSAPIR